MRNECDILLVNISVSELGFPLSFLLCWIGMRLISIPHFHFWPLDLWMMAALSLREGRSASHLWLCLEGILVPSTALNLKWLKKTTNQNISLNEETCCLWEFWEADRVLRGQGGQAEVKKNLSVPLIKKSWTSQHDSWYIPLDTPAFHFICSEKVWGLSSGHVIDACNFGRNWEAYLVSLSLLNM